MTDDGSNSKPVILREGGGTISARRHAAGIEKQPAVYIVASKKNGTIYIGVTSALWMRICDHKNGRSEGFTKKYGVSQLVWYEHHHSMASAIHREKRLKKWLRAWKITLIEKSNPDWRDLHDEIDSIATLVDEYLPRE